MAKLDKDNLPKDLNEVRDLITERRSQLAEKENEKQKAVAAFDADIAAINEELKVLESHFLKEGLFEGTPTREGFELVAVRKEGRSEPEAKGQE